ncbi:MAG TPA: TraR/DksA C4-type zinc finger protein [Gaiellaceae bacterium]|nr:TraR/DksA C4-type zinc finger protein [Gaiellaceae bacterium]
MSIDTERFHNLLLEERQRVERAIASLREDHPGRMDEEVEEISATQDNHLAETATVTLDREIDYTLEENSTRMLAAIDASLKRIESGTYGTCTNCDRAIPEPRLEAYPWASLCIDCKREAERG